MMFSSFFREAAGNRSGGKNTPTIAYHVSTLPSNIISTLGIAPDSDGFVHVFSKLAAAVVMKSRLSTKEIEATIWRVDVSGLHAMIDPSSAAISAEVAEKDDDDALHHGFMVNGRIAPERVLTDMPYG